MLKNQESRSGLRHVQLIDFKRDSGGTYFCEVVGEAPTFDTAIEGQNVSIIGKLNHSNYLLRRPLLKVLCLPPTHADPPDGPPVVHGLKHLYHPGEVIKLNCTSYGSRPTPRLSWSVQSQFPYNDRRNYTNVTEKYLVRYGTQSAEEGGLPSTLGLQFPASVQPDGRLVLRCQAWITQYSWATKVHVSIASVPVADPQQLPTLHGTKAPPGKKGGKTSRRRY